MELDVFVRAQVHPEPSAVFSRTTDEAKTMASSEAGERNDRGCFLEYKNDAARGWETFRYCRKRHHTNYKRLVLTGLKTALSVGIDTMVPSIAIRQTSRVVNVSGELFYRLCA